MRRIATLAVLVTGLALPAPLAFAHGNQFVCARVVIADDGYVALELTADYGDNPNIANAQEARQVLRDVLRVRIGDEVLPLEHFGALRFEERQSFSDDSPVPSASEPGPHRLVTASWQTRLPNHTIIFAAKEHTPFDVVMWRAGEQPTSGHSRWMLLIAGDKSPEFTMTSAAAGISFSTFFGVVVLAGLLLKILGWLSRRRRATPTSFKPSFSSP